MRLRLTKPAQRDLHDAVEWHGLNRPWLAERFLDDLQDVFQRVVENPERFPRVEVPVANTSREWRRVILKGFSYIIVYFIAGDAAVIVNISHTSRDWTARLTDKEE